MIKPDDFIHQAGDHGFDFYCGVPCSFLTPLIDQVIADDETDYIAASSEGEAVAIASGAWLAGKTPVMMCQNSGLGNAVNPLTSLNAPFCIPVLLIVTWRGKPGMTDEPQHQLMGEITPDLLALMKIPCEPFPKDAGQIAGALFRARDHMDQTGLPYALIMEKGDVEKGTVSAEDFMSAQTQSGTLHDFTNKDDLPKRRDILASLLTVTRKDTAVIATTGKCGRELFTLDDRAGHLYQVGSMGAASAMGLGVALNVKKPVVVLDGDGAALMKLGNLATIGRYAPVNLLHVLIDNGTYDSTGGQASVAPYIDFPKIADACNYRHIYRTDDVPGFQQAMTDAMNRDGPQLLHILIEPGSMKSLGRPTIKPDQVAVRFRKFLMT